MFSGSYCPAACKLTDMMLGSPSALSDLARSTPALNLTVHRQSNNVGGGALLVFFVGGFTLAEVSALRALQARHSVPIVVGGTSKECGRTVMQHFIGS